MRKYRILTAARLVALDACPQQVRLFRRLCGKQKRITRAWCISVADKFDWDWGAQHLLSASARAEYERVRASALAEYERVCASAWAECERVCASAWAECERVCASAWAECERVRASAWAECERVCAPAWAAAYINDTVRG